VVAVALPAIPQGISSVLFLVLLRQSIDSQQLTALMSRRSMVFNACVAVMTLVFGFWLKKMAFPMNYQIMFVAAFVLSLFSLLSVQRVRVLTEEPVALPDQAPLRPWRSTLFRRMAIVTVVVHISFFFISAIIPLRLVNELGADEGFMSLYALAELGAAATMAGFADRIVRRAGNQLVISVGLAASGVAALLLALAPSLPWTLLAGAVSGAAWTAAAISLFTYFSENTPADSLTRFSTVYNQVVLLSIFVGPMLGSQLASTDLGVDAVMVVGALLRLGVGIGLALIALGSVQRLARRRLALRHGR
jgi:predicted MFS family arabinose efflux permease